jgi:hypothetical protein
MHGVQTKGGRFNPGWLGGAVAALLLCSSPARADAIPDWNSIAAGAVTASGPGDNYERSRVMALVTVAMFEAVKVNESTQTSLRRVNSPASLSASNEAAAAAAAHYVLSQLYPRQQVSFSMALVRSLAAIPDGEEKLVGQIAGTNAGKSVYAGLASGAATPAAALSR